MWTYTLPPELIAHTAAEPRESARLLVWPEKTLSTFAHLHEFLNKGDLLVVNESKVLPARIYGVRKARVAGQGDVKTEILLHRPINGDMTRWEAMAKPGRRLREGDVIVLEGDAEALIEGWAHGFVLICLNISPADLEDYLNRHGHTPLPPYIHAEDTASVRARYQTVYARPVGSVAAPTAGLHLSETVFENLDKAGVGVAKVTLHVGAGTFQNPTPEQLASGQLHAEWCEVSPSTAARIAATRTAGKNVIAVGTTTLRTLESAARATGSIQSLTGETTLFIRPGFDFRVVDRLITNFHLPGSSLLSLVGAFIGEDALADLYARAIQEKLHFYSFGDGSLLTRNKDL